MVSPFMGGSGSASSSISGDVVNFSALPLASDHEGKYFLVRSAQGVWLTANRKPKGTYRSDGTNWTWMGTDILQASGTDLTTATGTEPKRWSPIDLRTLVSNNSAGKNGSFVNEFVAKHEYARLTTKTPTLNDNEQVVNNGSLRAYAQRIYIENALGIDYDNYKGELNSFVDLPFGVSTPKGWAYRTLNDSASHPAGFYIARENSPQQNTEMWGWEFRNLKTPAEWLVADGDYMGTTQQYTYTPTGVGTIAQAYCAPKSGDKDTSFYTKGEGDGDWSMIGDTKYRATNREDVQQYVMHVTPKWQQESKYITSSTADQIIGFSDGLNFYFDNNGSYSWNVKLRNTSGAAKGYNIKGLWTNQAGTQGDFFFRFSSIANNTTSTTTLFSSWNTDDKVRMNIIEGTSGSNFMPAHEWEIMMYHSSDTYCRVTWKQLY